MSFLLEKLGNIGDNTILYLGSAKVYNINIQMYIHPRESSAKYSLTYFQSRGTNALLRFLSVKCLLATNCVLSSCRARKYCINSKTIMK